MIARSSIAPEFVMFIRTTYPMVILIKKVKVGTSRKLLLREAAHDTVGYRNVLTLQQIKETETEIGSRRMVRISRKDRDGEPSRINPDS